MKKSKNIVLIVTPVLGAALLNACGGSSQPRPLANTAPATTPVTTQNPVIPPQTAQTRDVYNTIDDCIKDWGERDLCEQMGDDDDRDYRSKYKTKTTGKFFYGPQYSTNNRIITYKGKTLTPTGKVSKLPTYVSSVPASKTTSGTVPTSKTSTSTTTSSSSTTSTLPSTTSKSTTSTTSPSSTTSSTSSTSTYTPYSSSSTTRSGFGGGSSSYSSSSSSGS